MGDAIIVHLG